MSEVFLTAGVAAIFIAVVGGGAKALGFDVPGLVSGRRQIALGALGLVFIAAAVVQQEREKPDAPDPAVLAYRRQVNTACGTLPPIGAGIPPYEKNTFLTQWRQQGDTWHRILFKRWRQARLARRLQRENEERARDEERMDQLLDKIARTGKESLTEEERRFLERMSARRRNMS